MHFLGKLARVTLPDLLKIPFNNMFFLTMFPQVDEKSASDLPSNFFVNNLLATMALSDEPSAKRILCGNCDSEDAAQSRCDDCGIFLCEFCTESHKRARSTKHHDLSTMEEIKSNPGPQKIAEKARCSKHKDEIIKLFCKTCQTTICRDCTIVDHQGHKYGFVEDVAEEEKQKIRENLNDVKKRKDRVVEGIVNLENVKENVEAEKKSTISEINRHFDEFIRSVELKKMEMVEKANSIANSKHKQVDAQLDVLQVALASCESSIGFTERAFESGNNVQILSMEKYILQSLDQLKAVKDETECSVTEDVEFIIPSSVQEKNLNGYDVSIVGPVVSAKHCSATFKEIYTVFNPGERYSVKIVCYDKKKRRLSDGGYVIKPSFTGVEVSDVSVTDNKDGSYTIDFCPRLGGMLKFEASIDGMVAPSCSFTKKVTWVLSDVYGNGAISDNGRTMNGSIQGYCWRVGACYFESGIHTWNVDVRYNSLMLHGSGEVGIIDYEEINVNTNVSKRKKKWVLSCIGSLRLILDMGKKTLVVKVSNKRGSFSQGFQFTARRVSPFFSSNFSPVSITLVD